MKKTLRSSAAPLPREQQIERLTAEFLQFHPHVLEGAPVPPSRRLQEGDVLRNIGGLTDCVVASVAHDGKIVIVDVTQTDHNYGKPIVSHHVLKAFHWTECLKPMVGQVQPTAFAAEFATPFDPCLTTRQMEGLIREAKTGELLDSPDFQRDYVWTQADKESFLESIWASRPLGTFVFVNLSEPGKASRRVVLDGKQRLDALLAFIESRWAYRGVYFHELSPVDCVALTGVRVQVATIDAEDYTRAQLLRIFLDLNTAGVPQTDSHLAKVREMLASELEAPTDSQGPSIHFEAKQETFYD